MNTMETDESAVLSLTGDGYGLKVSREAIDLAQAILVDASTVTSVTNTEEMEAARAAVRQCANFRTKLEASRKAVKEPVLELGRKIDEAAKQFGEAVLNEESRITTLGKTYAAQQDRIRREEADAKRRQAEEAARKAAEEARRVAEEARRVQAEAARAAASEKAEVSKADMMRLAQENDARRIAAEREAARLKAELTDSASVKFESPAVVGTKVDWDYEVTDLNALHAFNPDFVELVPRRAVILKSIALAKQAEPTATIPGILITEKVRFTR